MSKTFNDVRASIEKRIAVELALAPSYPVSYQNVPFTPPNDTPWVQVFIRFGDNNYATLISSGTGYNRQTGTLVVNVYSPQGSGTGGNFAIAERIKDLFDRLQLDGIIFDAASGPSQIFPAAPEGFYQTQLTITFEAYLD